MRKNRDQLKALKRAYEECKTLWTKEEQKIIAKKLGLKEQQVYKWCWDQLQKRRVLENGEVQVTQSSSTQGDAPILKPRKDSCDDEFDEAIDSICEVCGINMQPLA